MEMPVRRLTAPPGRQAPIADAVVIDGETLAALTSQQAWQPIDLRQVTAAARIGPQLQAWASAFDPQGMHGLPVLWEALTLNVDPDRVVALIADPVAPNSLSLVFDPVIAEQVSACGITVQDDAKAAPMAVP